LPTVLGGIVAHPLSAASDLFGFDTFDSLRPHMVDRAYVNYLDRDDDAASALRMGRTTTVSSSSSAAMTPTTSSG